MVRERELKAAYVERAMSVYGKLVARLADALKRTAATNDALAELVDVLGPIAPGGLPVTPIEAFGDELDQWLRAAREAGYEV